MDPRKLQQLLLSRGQVSGGTKAEKAESTRNYFPLLNTPIALCLHNIIMLYYVVTYV